MRGCVRRLERVKVNVTIERDDYISKREKCRMADKYVLSDMRSCPGDRVRAVRLSDSAIAAAAAYMGAGAPVRRLTTRPT